MWIRLDALSLSISLSLSLSLFLPLPRCSSELTTPLPRFRSAILSSNSVSDRQSNRKKPTARTGVWTCNLPVTSPVLYPLGQRVRSNRSWKFAIYKFQCLQTMSDGNVIYMYGFVLTCRIRIWHFLKILATFGALNMAKTCKKCQFLRIFSIKHVLYL